MQTISCDIHFFGPVTEDDYRPLYQKYQKYKTVSVRLHENYRTPLPRDRDTSHKGLMSLPPERCVFYKYARSMQNETDKSITVYRAPRFIHTKKNEVNQIIPESGELVKTPFRSQQSRPFGPLGLWLCVSTSTTWYIVSSCRLGLSGLGAKIAPRSAEINQNTVHRPWATKISK